MAIGDDADIGRCIAAVYPKFGDKGFDVLDVLYAYGSGVDALVYGELFWPKFVEYKGMVIRAAAWQTDDQSAVLDAALERYGGDRQRAEQSINWIDVGELFGPRKLESSEAADVVLTELLKEIWTARLSLLFPERRFAVVTLDAEETGGGPGVSFSQVAAD